MAHAARVELSELQWRITLSRGVNKVFWLDSLNTGYVVYSAEMKYFWDDAMIWKSTPLNYISDLER